MGNGIRNREKGFIVAKKRKGKKEKERKREEETQEENKILGSVLCCLFHEYIQANYDISNTRCDSEIKSNINNEMLLPQQFRKQNKDTPLFLQRSPRAAITAIVITVAAAAANTPTRPSPPSGTPPDDALPARGVGCVLHPPPSPPLPFLPPTDPRLKPGLQHHGRRHHPRLRSRPRPGQSPP